MNRWNFGPLSTTLFLLQVVTVEFWNKMSFYTYYTWFTLGYNLLIHLFIKGSSYIKMKQADITKSETPSVKCMASGNRVEIPTLKTALIKVFSSKMVASKSVIIIMKQLNLKFFFLEREEKNMLIFHSAILILTILLRDVQTWACLKNKKKLIMHKNKATYIRYIAFKF